MKYKRLTLELRGELPKDRQRVSIVESRCQLVSVEEINAPYPWPDRLLVEHENGAVTTYQIAAASETAVLWEAHDNYRIIATRNKTPPGSVLDYSLCSRSRAGRWIPS